MLHFSGTLAVLSTITSPVWGISKAGYGVLVEGMNAIRQRIDIALRTSKRSDPLRPEFGSNIFKYIAAPDGLAIPNIKREILDCLELWVKDIKVLAIRSFLNELGNPVFEVYFRLVDDEITQQLIYDISSGVYSTTAASEIIIQAAFPSNGSGHRYNFNFKRNEVSVFPVCPPAGFATLTEMFAFMQTNYSYLGRWYMLVDRIVCYMNAEGVTSASLSINVMPTVQVVQANFPVLTVGEGYKVNLKIGGVNAVPSMPVFLTPGAVLNYALLNWSNYASWSIEFLIAGTTGVFSDEFSDEFDVNVQGYKLVGVSTNEQELTLEIIPKEL